MLAMRERGWIGWIGLGSKLGEFHCLWKILGNPRIYSQLGCGNAVEAESETWSK
jgi:hypothetical protein